MIYTLTINPAIDKHIFLDEFVKNRTNRPSKTVETIGGKGTHVSVNLNSLSMENCAVLIVSGRAGEKLVNMLHGVDVQTKVIRGSGFETRTNLIIVEKTGDSTIVAERGGAISEEDQSRILDVLRHNLRKGDGLVLSGDSSNTSPDLYFNIIGEFSPHGVRIFLDTSGESLKKSLEASPFLVKPNLDELSQICGYPLSDQNIPQVVDALSVFDPFGIEVVAVSLGQNGSIVRQGDVIFRAYAPEIQVKNTVGCGDSYLAGLVYGFNRNLSLEETLIVATAASAATAAHELSVGFDLELFTSLKPKVHIEQILQPGKELVHSPGRIPEM